MANRKPTADECRLIREAAMKETRKRRLCVEAAERVRMEGEDARNLNITLLTGREDLTGTDLHDFVSWADFRKRGFEFAEGGRAAIDFYCTSDEGLEGNVIAVWRDGVLERIEGVRTKSLYVRA